MTNQSFLALRLMNNTHIRYLLVVTRLIILLIPLLFHYHLVFPQWQNALLFKDEAACLTHQVFHAGCVQSKIPIFWTQMVAISTFWANSGSEPVRTWTGPYGTGSPANRGSGSGSATQDIVGQVQVQVRRKSARTGPEPDPGNFIPNLFPSAIRQSFSMQHRLSLVVIVVTGDPYGHCNSLVNTTFMLLLYQLTVH